MFSVVIPLYNKANCILETVNSVLRQTFPDFELIIVNDGSTDNSLDAIASVHDDRIIILNQRNSGVSSARNNGINHARFNYIALLDADDLWDKMFLEEMRKLIYQYPDVSLYGCGYSFQKSSGISTPDLGLPDHFKGELNYFVLAKDNTLFTSSSVVFKKKDFLELGGFDKSLARGEDIDLWIRFALNKKVAFYNKSLVIYKLNAENRALDKAIPKEKCLIWNLERFKKYELNNRLFKEFIDNWRLSHALNYLKRESTEVPEIRSLLRCVNLKNRSVMWNVLKYSPKRFHVFIYETWKKIRMVKN
jgi:glycosyltransferase involved in cell wall biosynthesis